MQNIGAWTDKTLKLYEYVVELTANMMHIYGTYFSYST